MSLLSKAPAPPPLPELLASISTLLPLSVEVSTLSKSRFKALKRLSTRIAVLKEKERKSEAFAGLTASMLNKVRAQHSDKVLHDEEKREKARQKQRNIEDCQNNAARFRATNRTNIQAGKKRCAVRVKEGRMAMKREEEILRRYKESKDKKEQEKNLMLRFKVHSFRAGSVYSRTNRLYQLHMERHRSLTKQMRTNQDFLARTNNVLSSKLEEESKLNLSIDNICNKIKEMDFEIKKIKQSKKTRNSHNFSLQGSSKFEVTRSTATGGTFLPFLIDDF